MMVRTVAASRQLVRNFGTCLKFVNSTDIINMGTANVFGTDFFWSGWVNWNGLNGAFQSIFAKRDSYVANQLMFDFNIVDTTGNLAVDTITSYVSFGVKLVPNTWTHVIWVHDKTAAQDRLYINGVLASTQGVATLGTGTTANVTIGGDQNPGQQNFEGSIDEVFIGTYVPTAAQIADAFYRSIYATANSWAWLKLDEGSGTTATDSSGNGNNGTITGATYNSAVVMVPRTTAALRSPVSAITFAGDLGTNPRISIPDNAIFHGLTAFTLELYLTINNIASTGFARIFDYATGNTGFNMYFNNQLRRLSTDVGNNTTAVHPNSNTVIPKGVQTHVAIVWDRSNVQFYIGGVKDGVVTALSGGNIGNPNMSLYIGNEAAADRAAAVTIRELRISNSARYSATFTPPTGALANDANTLELFHFAEGSGTTTTGVNGNVGTLAGTPTPTFTARTLA